MIKVKSNKKLIAVLGAGVAGLAAALELLENGQKVVIIESSKDLGGAAASIKIPENRLVPKGYHQIVKSDKKLLNILDKLGVTPKVKWKSTCISTFVDKKNINLASPKDMLLFKRLPLISRLRYMLMGARCLTSKDWSAWRNKTVTEFITKWADKNVLNEIFQPLIDVKFGFSTDEADAAWLGLRLSHSEGRTPFGFIPNASWTYELCKEFKERIIQLGGIIRTNCKVESFVLESHGAIDSLVVSGGEIIKVDAVLSTIPIPGLLSIFKKSAVSPKWFGEVEHIKYISCYSLLAGLSSVPFPDYWTVFLHPKRVFGGCFTISHLNDTLITQKDKAVINLFTNVEYGHYPWSFEKYAQKAIKDLGSTIGKKIKFNWVKVNIIKYVSPIFHVGYKNPKIKLGENIYFAGIYRTYPKFSSTGEALASGIETAKKCYWIFKFIMQKIKYCYRKRFNKKEIIKKNQFWKIICDSFLCKYIDPKDTVIDIGAGYCEFLNNITCKRKIAVDVNSDIKLFANQDVEVLNTAVKKIPTRFNQQMDIVFMSNFLEHLDSKEDVIKILQKMYQLLKKNGKLIIIQPNISLVKEKYWDFIDHKISLNGNSLYEVLNITNFTVVEYKEKFLPYTTKNKSSLLMKKFIVELYLKLPQIFRFLAGQSFIVSKK